MDADPTNRDVPQNGPSVVGDSGNVAICAGCQRPLTRTGPGGECLRCLLGFALSADDVPSPAPADEESGHLRQLPPATPRRYGQFEVAVGFDGLPVELGAGAMAVTYRAHDTVLDSAVALKVINKNLAEHPAARARFLREARAAARLHHPNVASVTHYGEQDGECYYAMELVEGETLEQKVRRDGPMPVALAVDVGVQVARALAAAEACGVVHRDLKPSNLMLTARQGDTGESDALMVKVIDWGLVKAVSDESAQGADHTRGAFIGTPAFASPEQFTNPEGGRRIDARADIYSLGVTLWYLLCGRTPFSGRSLEEIHARQINGALPVEQLSAVRVPGSVVALLKSMLAVDPGARPQSARELLEALRRCQERFPGVNSPPTSHHRRASRQTAGALALLVVLAVGVAAWWLYARSPQPVTPLDKSIAVLPFENLSPDPADKFFTIGVQDQIIVDLGRVADLKVVSSEGAKSDPAGKPLDLAAIGRELGVRHLLNGSVQRQGEQMNITVRLTSLRDPAHPWTQRYERRLTEVFAVQGEITRAVADRLQASLSPGEKAAINRPPTADLAAYDLYLRAREIPGPNMWGRLANGREGANKKVALLEEAIARDPNFTLAYCELARMHDDLFFYRHALPEEDLPVDHRSMAEVALAKARRLEPDAGEVHLTLATHALQINHDIEQARLEVDLACRALPNSAPALLMAGRLARRLDHWEEAIRSLERAVALEPRNVSSRSVLAGTYDYQRRYDDFDRATAEIIALTPTGELRALPLYRADGPLEARADLAPLRAAFAAQVAANQLDEEERDLNAVLLALWGRDGEAASRLLAASKLNRFHNTGVAFPKAWFEALAARQRGDAPAANAALTAARMELQKEVMAAPTEGMILGYLAVVDAGLGHKEEAVREGKRACELANFQNYNLVAPTVRCNLAVVYAWTGQPDLAFAELEPLVGRPGGNNHPALQPTYGDFRLNPLWDPLRNDPRFETLGSV